MTFFGCQTPPGRRPEHPHEGAVGRIGAAQIRRRTASEFDVAPLADRTHGGCVEDGRRPAFDGSVHRQQQLVERIRSRRGGDRVRRVCFGQRESTAAGAPQRREMRAGNRGRAPRSCASERMYVPLPQTTSISAVSPLVEREQRDALDVHAPRRERDVKAPSRAYRYSGLPASLIALYSGGTWSMSPTNCPECRFDVRRC